MELNRAIQGRKSVKKFSSQKPDWRDIIECIDAARYAPMAGNIYTLKFIIVDDKDKIQKIADSCQQPFVADAHYVIVVCSDTKKTINAYEEKGKIYCRQQAGAAIQNFLLKTEEKELATCWTGYFVESMLKRVLEIPGDIDVEAVFPIGYASKAIGQARQKKETNIDNILYFDKYGNKKMRPVKKLEV